jgi:hypothetical protein
MNFLNSYILIFNLKIKSINYLRLSLFIILLFLIIAFILNRLDLNISDNDIIKKFQLKKIEKDNFKNVDTIVVGDSSAGNSFDSNYFSKISELNTKNLSLTGSWGIIGSLGIIKKSLKKNKNIKNIIIIQTLDILSRDFSKQSVLELYDIEEIISILSIEELIAYMFNIKELWWHLKYMINEDFSVRKEIDYRSDYLKQKNKKFSNKKLKINPKKTFNDLIISKEKLKELKMLDVFCDKEKLNCIFLNGPIHKVVANNSSHFFNNLEIIMKKKLKKIKYFPNIFIYENYKMGDTIDHIDIKYKKESTLKYFNIIKDNLKN